MNLETSTVRRRRPRPHTGLTVAQAKAEHEQVKAEQRWAAVVAKVTSNGVFTLTDVAVLTKQSTRVVKSWLTKGWLLDSRPACAQADTPVLYTCVELLTALNGLKEHVTFNEMTMKVVSYLETLADIHEQSEGKQSDR